MRMRPGDWSGRVVVQQRSLFGLLGGEWRYPHPRSTYLALLKIKDVNPDLTRVVLHAMMLEQPDTSSLQPDIPMLGVVGGVVVPVPLRRVGGIDGPTSYPSYSAKPPLRSARPYTAALAPPLETGSAPGA
jgi:hypothetical protein